MRRYFLSFGMIIAAVCVFAQGQKGPSASFEVIKKSKGASASLTTLNNQPAVMVVLPYAPATVLRAMEEYEINCYRSEKKQSDAYVAFDKTALMQNNKKGAPLIFNVGSADPQREDQSIVYLLLNTPVDKGDYAGSVHKYDANEALAYLENLAVAVQVINIDHQIKANMAKLKKEEKLQERYAKRCDRLSDEKKENEEKIAQNKPSAVKRDQRLELRLTESQSELALHKTTAEKKRADVTNLTNQKKSIYR